MIGAGGGGTTVPMHIIIMLLSKPALQSHWKPPGTLTHVPLPHGFSAIRHSSMSVQFVPYVLMAKPGLHTHTKLPIVLLQNQPFMFENEVYLAEIIYMYM